MNFFVSVIFFYDDFKKRKRFFHMRNTDRVNIAGHRGWKFLKLSHIESKKILKNYLVKVNEM